MNNKARTSYSCERFDFQGFNIYPWRTLSYTEASKVG